MIEVKGVIVSLERGWFNPSVVVHNTVTLDDTVCKYGSHLANAAGMDNPWHWAHGIFRSLLEVCNKANKAAAFSREPREPRIVEVKPRRMDP